MTRKIRRVDPAYDAAMREAKAQFDDAMSKGVMRMRGRPSKPVPQPVAPEPPATPAEDDAEHDAEH